MPALAVVGADHQIIRSTESWRRKYESAAAQCERAPELDLVLNGQADVAVVDLGEISVAIEAVTDGAGKRQAMLSLPAEDLAADPESPLTALGEAADESPAIVWAKDLEGRYLYANARYLSDLEVSEDRLIGNTDADLPPGDTVDGPRLRYTEDGLEEPLQLEYNVPEYESRPAMVAFRFALRSGSGKPVGTCGVAAPINESQVARDEAVRLMQLERWNRLDPLDVRAEVLEQWHVQPRPGPAPQLSPEPTSIEVPRNGKPDAADAGGDSARAADNGQVAGASVESGPIVSDDGASVNGDAPEQQAADAPSELAATDAVASAQPELDPPRAPEDDYQREDEWVRQLREAARLSPQDAAFETGGALQTDLQLARKWAERADQLQGDLHEAHARLQRAETEARRAAATAELAEEEASRHRAEVDELRHQLEREKGEAHAARSEVEAARRELVAARDQAELLRGPADAALRLTDELGRALTAEQERGDELARALARIRSRLGDLEGALDRSQPAVPGA